MFTNSISTQEDTTNPHVLTGMHTDREAIMTDSSLFTNPAVVGGTITAGLAAVTTIIVTAINKRKTPKDYQADVQRVLTESFKVLTDGYEKQIRVVMDGYEKQLHLLEDKIEHATNKVEKLEADKARQAEEIMRQSEEIVRQAEEITRLNADSARQKDEISRQKVESDQQKLTISNLESELQRLRARATASFKRGNKSTEI